MKRIILVLVVCISLAGKLAAQDITITAPSSIISNTCGASNDCNLSPSEDLIIRVNIPCDGDWNFTLCGSSFNTNMFLTTAICSGTTLASNDDFCGQQSEISITLVAGTYYLAVEGSTISDCGSFTLVVKDVEAPVIQNCQSDITVINTLGDCGAVVNYSSPTATDNCLLTSFTGTHSSGELFPVGTTTVIYTAEDASGNTSTCSFDITVVDIQMPVIANCPGNISVPNTIGQCGASVSWAVPTPSDNCGISSFTSTYSSGAFFPTGTTTVTYTAVDNNGNSVSCSFTVTVTDTEVPQISCPANIVVNNTSGQCGAVVTFSITGTDNCSGAVTSLAAGLPSGSFFPVGNTLQSFLVTDLAGNVATCSFTVSVIDNEPPVFNCPADLLVCGQNSVVNFSVPTFTDNCSGGSAIQVSGPFSGTVFSVGTHTVSFQATDSHGNTSICSYDILVAYDPVADYGYNTSCAGDLIFFTESSTIPAGTVDSYSWDMGDGSGSVSIRNPVYQFPSTGSYEVSLTATSNMGCTNTHTETVIITDVPSASFVVSSQCAGLPVTFNNTSTIITGSLNYVWNFGDGTSGTGVDPVHTYLNSGTYTVILTATSFDGCVDVYSSTININANPLANFTTTNLQCFGDGSGALNISGYGSLSPYQYSIDDGNNFQSSGVFNNLDAGNYTALIEDDNGCSSAYNFSVSQPVELISSLSNSIDVNCYGDQNGSILVSASGGVTPYYFTLDNVSFQLSPVFNNLGSGDYSVFVSDANGCLNTVDVTLSEPSEVTASVFTQTNVQCTGNNSGYLELLAVGGVPPYQYSINGGQSFQSNPNFYNLIANTYSIVVKDHNNCVKSFSATITQPEPLAFSVDVNDVSCFGEFSGAISFSVTGGTSPFQYSTDAGQTYQPLSLINNLAAGNYVVSVKDAHNCTVSGGAFVNQPLLPLEVSLASQQNVLCRGGNSGSATIDVTGGTETYRFSIDGGLNFQTINNISGLVEGNYSVLVEDFNGCSGNVPVTISQPTEDLRIDLVVIEDVQCHGDGSGSIGITAGGGTPAFQYSNNEGATYQSSPEFTGLSGGTYNIRVRDANGCTIANTSVLSEPANSLTLNFNGSTNVICENDTIGSLSVTGTGGVPPYLYFLDGQNGQLSGIFSGLSSGTFNVMVKDMNACLNSLDITIDAVSYLPNVDFSYQVAGQSVGFVNLTSGGQTYAWNFGDGTTSLLPNPTHLYNSPGQYTVKLLATNNCGVDSVIKNISTLFIGINESENISSDVFPNPADNQIILNLTAAKDFKNININIHSVDGRLLFSEKFTNPGNIFTHTFNTQNFSEGIYILEVVADDTHSSSLITIYH